MSAASSAPRNDKIKHIILLAQENRSFDQVLGGMQKEIPEIDGVFTKDGSLRRNSTPDGYVYEQNEIFDKQIGFDPKHEHEDVKEQLSESNGGFIRDFFKNYPKATEADKLHIMGFYPAGYLPALHELVRHFRTCDRWHSSVPGPTWPNRNFLLSGTTRGKIKMPDGMKDLDMAVDQRQDTIFDRLNEKGISWKSYYHDLPSSWLLCHQQHRQNMARYFKFEQFMKDTMDEATFPAFTFIEPRYYGSDQNDDHPPHNIMKGQKLIADIYNAVRANPELWESTLIVFLYDEHGGFFDHVVPPKAVPPGVYENSEYTFDQLGIRVPAVLVSPWVKPGVEHQLFDHTSLLRYLIDKWELGELGERARTANSIECCLQFETPITSAPERIEVSAAQLETPRPELEDDSLSDHHQALIHLKSIAQNAILREAIYDAALYGKDPAAFKRRVYPWVDVVGKIVSALGMKKAGAYLSGLYADFLREEVERTIAHVEVAVDSAKKGEQRADGGMANKAEAVPLQLAKQEKPEAEKRQ